MSMSSRATNQQFTALAAIPSDTGNVVKSTSSFPAQMPPPPSVETRMPVPSEGCRGFWHRCIVHRVVRLLSA